MGDEFVMNHKLTMEMMQLIAIKTFTALISKTVMYEDTVLYLLSYALHKAHCHLNQ